MTIRQMIKERDRLNAKINQMTTLVVISNFYGDTPREEFDKIREELRALCLDWHCRDLSGYDGTQFVHVLTNEDAKQYEDLDMF